MPPAPTCVFFVGLQTRPRHKHCLPCTHLSFFFIPSASPRRYTLRPTYCLEQPFVASPPPPQTRSSPQLLSHTAHFTSPQSQVALLPVVQHTHPPPPARNNRSLTDAAVTHFGSQGTLEDSSSCRLRHGKDLSETLRSSRMIPHQASAALLATTTS